jgi:transcriptional regulator with XRE-family HTH domain
MSKVTAIDVVIARNMRLLRVHRQMDQRDVSDRMFQAHPTWTRQTVSEIERGRRAVLVSEARDLAAIFGVSLPFLLEEMKV